jgi:hypothetical protein
MHERLDRRPARNPRQSASTPRDSGQAEKKSNEMAQKLDVRETSMKPKVGRGGNQTGGGYQKLVPLLKPGFSLSDTLRDVTGQNRRERVFIQAPLCRWHFGGVTKLFAVTNDPAVELRNKTCRGAGKNAPLRLQSTGHNSLKSLPDIFRHAVFTLVIIAVYTNCCVKTRLHGQNNSSNS